MTGYYWKEYLGNIPTDAIIGGTDVSGRNIYIAQAYVSCRGSIPAMIYQGDKEIHVATHGGTVTTGKNIKVQIYSHSFLNFILPLDSNFSYFRYSVEIKMIFNGMLPVQVV